MTAEPAAQNKPTASWLPGGVLVTLHQRSPGAEVVAGERDLLFDHQAQPFRLSLACAHEPDARANLAPTLHGSLCDWQTFLREHLAPLDGEVRTRITDFLAFALERPCCRQAGGRQLSTALQATREGLRERLPITSPGAAQPFGLKVDALAAIADGTFYVRGWCRDDGHPEGRLIAVSPEGARVELAPNISRFLHANATSVRDGRPGEKAGFVCCFKGPSIATSGGRWLFEWHGESGESVESQAPELITDLLRSRDSILGDLALEKPPGEELLVRHIHPALATIQHRHHSEIAAVRIQQFGPPPADPYGSVIIPLYRRIDFLEHQLAQFVCDSEFRDHIDLIYVLDSPELADDLAAYAARLSRLYPVPFRIVTLNRNGGYSAANNVAAKFARAKLLLLLNSDVLPDRPGWFGEMARFYQANHGIGALGPKLLFEDETIQHAGLHFAPMIDGSGWENQHFFKGLHRTLPAANVTRPVPAVTGACLLIESALYEKLGGFSGSYVQGDYEDSDLCLRLSQAGYRNWYLPSVELYHLEGQSYPAPLRALASRYNRWLHSRTWQAEISATMETGVSYAKPEPCP